jgi:hypothetical protein
MFVAKAAVVQNGWDSMRPSIFRSCRVPRKFGGDLQTQEGISLEPHIHLSQDLIRKGSCDAFLVFASL